MTLIDRGRRAPCTRTNALIRSAAGTTASGRGIALGAVAVCRNGGGEVWSWLGELIDPFGWLGFLSGG
jgi:hypothetical protein